MGVEIERKFTVRADFCPQGAGTEMAQGYLSRDPQRTVRVRLAGGRGYLTVKGETRGMVRAEYEYEIPLADARSLLELCGSHRLSKVRHLVPYQGHTWEVDIFTGRHEGLVLAEIELSSIGEQYDLPPWVGEEVTGDPRYYNAMLARKQ